MPLVSVIIPTYNRADLIGEAVTSVLNQTFDDFEVIVVDDGSTDNTKEAIDRIEGPIRYIYQENKGLSGARNPGIDVAGGEYIAFLDSDDLWLPEKLAEQVRLLDQNSSAGFVYTDYEFVDGDGRSLPKPENYLANPLRNGWILKHLLSFDFIPPSTVMVRKDCLRSVGLFNTSLKQGTDDFDLLLRLVKRYEAAFVDRPLTKIRVHGNNWSTEEIAGGTINVLTGHLSMADTKEALGNEWAEVYHRCYLTMADYKYSNGEMKKAREYYLKSLRLQKGKHDINRLLILIAKTVVGNKILEAARSARNAITKSL